MKTLLVFFILFLSSCGFDATKKIVSIDPAMQQFVNDFVEEGAKENVSIVIDSLIIQFATTSIAPADGICYGSVTEVPRILIDRTYWNYADDSTRRVILFHELGHCILLRDHLNTWTNGIVTSIMYYSLQSTSMYLNHWAYYMHELFHGY